MTIEDFFEGRAGSRHIYDAIAREISTIGKICIHVSKSQIAFKRRRNVATVWVPAHYLKGDVAPLVLTLSFPKQDPSDRWKEIIQISSNRFTHHLELYNPSDIDDQVKGWLRVAWEAA
jgi:predicted transport protein